MGKCRGCNKTGSIKVTYGSRGATTLTTRDGTVIPVKEEDGSITNWEVISIEDIENGSEAEDSSDTK